MVVIHTKVYINSITIVFRVSETHLSPFESANLIQDLTPPDYNFYHIPWPDRAGGGVGCFINSSLTGTKVFDI
jgi:hypothetical protein